MTLLDDRSDTLAPAARHFDPGLARIHSGAVRRRDIADTDQVPCVRAGDPAPAGADGDEHHVVGGVGSGTPALVLSIPFPGLATWRRRRGLAALLVTGGTLAPIALFAWVLAQRSRIIGLALDPTFLSIVVAIGVLAVVCRVVAIAEVAYAYRRSPGIAFRSTVTLLVTALLSLPVVSIVSDASSARDAVSAVFESGSGEPLYVPGSAAVTASGVVVDPAAVSNILIIGGDAGPGRWGMRTDTMMLVSIHGASGRTALTSIPRNLTSLRFPPDTPLATEFPNGFDDLANALFTHVNSSPTLTAHYGSTGRQPEAMALVEALGFSLNVRIDDFALVNMQGFTDVIDSLGGVTLELTQSVPLPPSLPGERPLPTEIGPGFVEMDGALAIAYARSRSADSDYQRMVRQRQLLAALGSQISATTAARAIGSVTGQLDESMRTSLSAGEFDDLLSRLGDNAAITESVGLAPPLVTPGNPDYAQIAMIVAGVQQALIDGVPSGYVGV